MIMSFLLAGHALTDETIFYSLLKIYIYKQWRKKAPGRHVMIIFHHISTLMCGKSQEVA